MAKTLTARDEQLLTQGVQQAVQLVDREGYTPDAALAKVAKDLRYTPGMLKTACFAYNTGRQLSQWNSAESVLDKLASFPLANFEEARKLAFDHQVKTAEYVQPAVVPFRTYDDIRPQVAVAQAPVVEKVAEAPAQKTFFAQAERHYDNCRREVARTRTEKFAAEQKLDHAFQSLLRYFSKLAHDRKPFAQVEFFSRLRHPEVGEAIFDSISTRLPKEKRATDYPLTWAKFAEAVDYTREPYTYIDAIAELVEPTLAADERHRTAVKQASDAAAALMQPVADELFPLPTVDTLLGTITVPAAQEKLAAFDATDVLSYMTGRQMASRLDNEYAKRQQQVAEKAIEFDDPDHLNELRKIRAQTALSQLLSDEDDPLSEADPGQVMSAYNSLVHMAPRLADQPEALGPLLRKRIVGKQEPFEAEQVLKFEEGLRKTQPSLSAANLFSGGTNASNVLG